MSETTNKMRDVAIYSDSLIRVRDLTADAIEAVEAQVAEAAARVAALEKRPTIVSAGSQDDDRVKPAPVRRFKVGDRIRFVAEPKWVKGYLGALGTIKRLKGDASLDYYIASDVSGTNGDHVSANDADLEPAPSAVPEPRGFRVGDRVRPVWSPNEPGWRINDIDDEGLIYVEGWTRARRSAAWRPSSLTLVRAADAPEAPAEDAGLVERCAEAGWAGTPGLDAADWRRRDGSRDADSFRTSIRAVLAALTAEGRLCAPGEVARLTADRDDWKYAAEVQKKDTESWKARAETAEKALADANDRLTSQSRSIEEMHAELTAAQGEMRSLRATISVLRADLAALKAKPRFRTRKVTAKDVGAWEEEWCKDSYGAGERHKAMNALGFRRRVDGAK